MFFHYYFCSERRNKARVNSHRKIKPVLFPVRWSALCTPGMGVSLWGESPLYENRKLFIPMDTTKSTSRRQGRLREEGSVSPG